MSTDAQVTMRELPFNVDAFCEMDAVYTHEPHPLHPTIRLFIRHNAIAHPEMTGRTPFRVRRHADGFDVFTVTGENPSWGRLNHEGDPPLWVRGVHPGP
jgi:hypothetical protein